MILSKDSNSNWTPTATGNGTFVGTRAAFNAVKNSLPNNTVAYITDDGGSIVDEVTNGDMRAVTSNAVYDELNTVTTGTATIDTTNVNSGVVIWKKLGRLVFVTIMDLSPKSTGSNISLATGLPKCLGRQDFVISGNGSYCDVGVDGTTLKAKYGAQLETTPLNGSVVYIYDPS